MSLFFGDFQTTLPYDIAKCKDCIPDDTLCELHGLQFEKDLIDLVERKIKRIEKMC